MNTPLEETLKRLKASRFRSRFRLCSDSKRYLSQKGFETIESHARDFVRTRLSSRQPENDGKQTPMRGHPVFIAQHATATCCRSCLHQWHKIPMRVPIDPENQERVVQLITGWLQQQMTDDREAVNRPDQPVQRLLFESHQDEASLPNPQGQKKGDR